MDKAKVARLKAVERRLERKNPEQKSSKEKSLENQISKAIGRKYIGKQ